MLDRIRSLLRDTRGAHYAEYLVIIVVVVLVGIAAYGYFGGEVSQKVQDSADALPGPNSGGG